MDKPNDFKMMCDIIRILERKLTLLEENQILCFNVTMSQCHVLVGIGCTKSISLIELAKLLNADNSIMSRTVNRLVNRDLVKRDLDPKDRRFIQISLTEKGQKLFDEIEEIMNTYYNRIFNSIPDNKKSQVIESLQILLEAIDNNECCK